MPSQDRWDRYFEEYADELLQAHEAGEHKDNIDHDCGACYREVQEAMNREGDPAFNGAFNAW